MFSDETHELFFLRRNSAGAQRQNDIARLVSSLDPCPRLIKVKIFTCLVLAKSSFLEAKREKEAIPVEEKLLRDPACQHPEVSSRVASGKVVAAPDFEVSLLKKRRPKKTWVFPINYEKGAVCARGWEPVVDYDTSPTAVEVHT